MNHYDFAGKDKVSDEEIESIAAHLVAKTLSDLVATGSTMNDEQRHWLHLRISLALSSVRDTYEQKRRLVLDVAK